MGLTALVIVLAILLRKPPPEVVVSPPPPPTLLPSPTSAPSATPAAVVELASEWVVASTPEPTPTPTPWPTAPPPVRREPKPTPGLSSCVTFRWTTVQIFNPSAQVLTEITAKNNCDRDLGPLDLLFEISGWRDGGLVQSVRARPFDRIRRGHTGIVSVGLPGSIDWYDRITVEIVE